MEKLKLFYMEGCPYCDKVRLFMKDNDINVEMVDIHVDPKNKEELETIGGKIQVPMLLIDKDPLYESEDIIQWFKKNK